MEASKEQMDVFLRQSLGMHISFARWIDKTELSFPKLSGASNVEQLYIHLYQYYLTKMDMLILS
jgi:hypothetical protein